VTQNEESSTTFINDDGDVDFDDDHGELYNPKWKGQLGVRLNISDFRFSWITNYIGKTYQDPDGVPDWSNIYGSPRSDTCYGPPGDYNCRDYFDTDEYWLHSASLYWYGDTWTVGAGIRNVFDEEPPMVNSGWYTQVNNVPIGAGYDLFGRTYFLNVVWRP
jgi:iron complex outermembrane receptor protein